MKRFANVSSLRFNSEADVHVLWLNLWALIAGFFMANDRGSAFMAGPSLLKAHPRRTLAQVQVAYTQV
jgi:hypothetical protein